MNELEIKEYILNIINTKAEDIENHGGITLCFSNLKEDNLFFGKHIKDEKELFNAIKHFKKEFREKYIIDLKQDSITLSDTSIEVYHVIIKNNMAKVDSLSDTKKDKDIKKIDVELYQYENLVFGKVLYVDKELIGEGTLVRNDEYRIYSGYFPSIHNDGLSTWGLEERHNNDIILNQFNTTAEAAKWVSNIKTLLDELNGTEKAKSKVKRVI